MMEILSELILNSLSSVEIIIQHFFYLQALYFRLNLLITSAVQGPLWKISGEFEKIALPWRGSGERRKKLKKDFSQCPPLPIPGMKVTIPAGLPPVGIVFETVSIMGSITDTVPSA